MIAIPAWVGAASRILRRGSIYFLPPIRFNIPVNVHAGGSQQVLKIGNRVLRPDDLYEIVPEHEYKWPIPNSDWATCDITEEQRREMTERFGEPELRICGADLVLRDGQIIWVDRKQYWKLQGHLLQIGTEI
jgi:hypothetical protein